MHGSHVILLFISLIFLMQCGSHPVRAVPPSIFTESQLIGHWENDHIPRGTEKLEIAANHTFRQYYQLAPTEPHIVVEGTWMMEQKPNGCISLHMQGMQNIHLTAESIQSGNRYPDGQPYEFQDLCDLTTLTMLDKVVLSIVEEQRDSSGFMLLFPCASADCLEQSFHRITP